MRFFLHFLLCLVLGTGFAIGQAAFVTLMLLRLHYSQGWAYGLGITVYVGIMAVIAKMLPRQ